MYREIYLTDRRFNMTSRAKKYVAVLLVFVCVCMIFSPQTAYAAEDSSQHETVKVGFFAMDGYHVMDEEGNRSGYGYDFLRLMARYWDVDYEYVGYDKSWDDMQQMLEDGEIDMVTSPRKTPEREEKFDFSRRIGTNNGILTRNNYSNTLQNGFNFCKQQKTAVLSTAEFSLTFCNKLSGICFHIIGNKPREFLFQFIQDIHNIFFFLISADNNLAIVDLLHTCH